jgi:hypothetical protein
MRLGLNETDETTVDHLIVHLRVLFGMEDSNIGDLPSPSVYQSGSQPHR